MQLNRYHGFVKFLDPLPETVMQMNIQCRGFTLTEGLRDYARNRLACSLSHGEVHVVRVIMRLSDINGPRGGEDKRCHLEVRLKGLPGVVVEDTQTDLYLAIDRAAERAGRTLARHMARGRRDVHGPRPHETIGRPDRVDAEEA